jgi:hypothetical protein
VKFEFEGTTEEWEVFTARFSLISEAKTSPPFSRQDSRQSPEAKKELPPVSSVSGEEIDPRENQLPECLKVHTAAQRRLGNSQLKDLPEISLDERLRAWEAWTNFVSSWIQNFEVQGAVQPNRASLMEELGAGRNVIPLLVMGYEAGSLQKMIVEVYRQRLGPSWEITSESLDFIERISGTMCQVSHSGFPDLVGLHDYTLRWRREFNV